MSVLKNTNDIQRVPPFISDSASEPNAALAEFRMRIVHGETLAPGARRADAVISVAARHPSGHPVRGPDAAEVIILDCSSSMLYPPEKLSEARRAAITAIDTLRDGVAFAVVAGTARARMVYPPVPHLVPATDRTRAEARAALAGLRTESGTAIGAWLTLANSLFEGHDRAIRHAILLTDGHDEHETPEALRAALAECEGRFTCDCRGVGDGWVVNELRMVSSVLLGTTMRIRRPEDLADDFRRMTEVAMDKVVGEVSLRVWTPTGATVHLVRQEMPEEADLTDRRREVAARTGDYPLGAWGEEQRDYHLAVETDGEVGDEMLVARVAVVVHGPEPGRERVVAEGRVRVRWAGDPEEAAAASAEVAHYSRQAELGLLMRRGSDAILAGDGATAVESLGAALALATELGDDRAAQIATLVELTPDGAGAVRLRDSVQLGDVMDTQLASVRTRPLSTGGGASTGRGADPGAAGAGTADGDAADREAAGHQVVDRQVAGRQAAGRDGGVAARTGAVVGESAWRRVPIVPGRYPSSQDLGVAASSALPVYCPRCGDEQTGPFCEGCGHQYEIGRPA